MSPCHMSQPLSLSLSDTHIHTVAQLWTPDPLLGAHGEARPVQPHLGPVCLASPVMLTAAGCLRQVRPELGPTGQGLADSGFLHNRSVGMLWGMGKKSLSSWCRSALSSSLTLASNWCITLGESPPPVMS